MPPALDQLDADSVRNVIVTEEDFRTLRDMNAYVKISNKPKTKGLKSKQGPDLNAGDMGNPVLMTTDTGWVYAYHLASGKEPACLELAACRYQDSKLLEDEVAQATHQSKTFRSAIEVVDFLLDQGWEKFSIEEGSDLLSWSVWAYLKYLKKPVTGYKETEFDEIRYKNSEDLFAETSKSVKELVNTSQVAMTKASVSIQSADEKDES